MMYCEFIERTKYGERYIDETMYHQYIEPAYMEAPDEINKDQFCKDFYKLETAAVSTVISGLITATPTETKERFINGENSAFTDIHQKHTVLLNIFLEAFQGIYKNYCREHYRK